MLKNKAIQSFVSILRAVAILFLTIGITERSCFMFNIYKSDYQEPLHFDWLLNTYRMFFFILSFLLISFAVGLHNRHEKCLHKNENKSLSSCFKETFKSADFYIEAVVISLLTVVLPSDFVFKFAKGIFFVNKNYTNSSFKISVLAIMLPIMLFIMIGVNVLIRKKWSKSEKSSKEANELKSVIKSVIITVALLYGLAFVIPMFIPPAVAVWEAGGIKVVLGVLAVIVAPFLLAILFYSIRATLKRQKFISQLKKHCKENQISFSIENKGEFQLEKDGKKYCCKIIKTLFPNSPTTFIKGEVVETKNYFRFIFVKLFYITTTSKITFNGDGKRVLIVLPDINIMYSHDGKAKKNRADNGEKTGDCTIYNSFGFFNALDRNML